MRRRLKYQQSVLKKHETEVDAAMVRTLRSAKRREEEEREW